MELDELKVVNKSVKKIQSEDLLLGKPAFTDDFAPTDALIVKLLKSPHANAIIKVIDTSIAKKVPGIVDIYTWEDVPKNRFTTNGLTYPEPSAYDRLILDRHLRFIGDPVAIVVAETEKIALKAMKLIKVTYDVLEPLIDFRKAKDSKVIVHPEEDWSVPFDTHPSSKGATLGADKNRNLVASGVRSDGNVDEVFKTCDVVLERTYSMKAFSQTPMENFSTFTEIDKMGNLRVVSSTQVIFHCRRILAKALGIPVSKLYVERPRIGGGFGAKGSVVSEIYPTFATLKTGRPCKMVYTREESMTIGSPRHATDVTVRIGAMKDGTIRAIDLYTLLNAGAYSEQTFTVALLVGHKSIPLYTANLEAYRFAFEAVYTNLEASGAYRGYGVPQGTFAVETIVNELADKLGIDPIEIRNKNMLREGMLMKSYDSIELANACALDRCMERCKKMFNWDEKYPVRDMGHGKVRTAGVAMSVQGSGIPGRDIGGATVKALEDGTFSLTIGVADLGTGSDTILAQMVAECMECDINHVQVFDPGTDFSPYDSGSYASAGTYVTGQATVNACEKLKKILRFTAAEAFDCDLADITYSNCYLEYKKKNLRMSVSDAVYKSQNDFLHPVQVTEQYTSHVSPPPYMVGMIEIELDKDTGHVEILDYCAVVDCGTPINPALCKIQTEGGLAQAIGHTLTENVTYTNAGQIMENSLMQYKIPTRLDVGHMRVEFENSYEPTGPFGAKSIGEITINTPAPAIVQAIQRATGVWHRDLPVTPEMIAMSVKEKN